MPPNSSRLDGFGVALSPPDLKASSRRSPSMGMAGGPSVSSSFVSAVLYLISAVSMIMMNKLILQTYSFRFPNTLIFSQSVVCVVLLSALHRARVITLPPMDWLEMRKVAPVSLFYCLNMVCALGALSHLAIPIYNVIKRCTVLIVMLEEIYIMKKRISRGIKSSVLVIVGGAIVAGWSDLGFSLYAYGLGLTSCVLHAGYLISISKAGLEEGRTDSTALLYYSCLQSLPFLALLILATGELPRLAAFPDWGDGGFRVALGATLGLGIALHFSTVLCTQSNSPLTTTIVGHLKVIITTTFGYMFFTARVTGANVAGVVISCTGGCLYSYCKLLEKREKLRAAGLEAPAPGALLSAGGDLKAMLDASVSNGRPWTPSPAPAPGPR